MSSRIRAQVANAIAQTFGSLAQSFQNHIKYLESHKAKTISPEQIGGAGMQAGLQQPQVSPQIQPTPTPAAFGPSGFAQPVSPLQQPPAGGMLNQEGLTPRTGSSGIGAPRTGLSLGNF